MLILGDDVPQPEVRVPGVPVAVLSHTIPEEVLGQDETHTVPEKVLGQDETLVTETINNNCPSVSTLFRC